MVAGNLNIKILAHLLANRKKSVQEIAKSCLISLTSVSTVKSQVDRLIDLGVIKKSITE